MLLSLSDCTIHPGMGESIWLGQDVEPIAPGLSIQLPQKKFSYFLKLGF